MAAVDPLSGFHGVRLSPDAVIAKYQCLDLPMSLLFGKTRKTMPLKPSDVLSLAEAYREKKEYLLAEELLRGLVDGRERSSALFSLGLCCHGRERHGEAARWYGEYLAQSPAAVS
ncbi:MAG: tetratricopeptide repeat protein [Candidatus Eremiobacteraeota bacterium]|nr:tetratricopeptide repeat protein [Candidatus Eremiobacteraeota bacterium]